MESMSELSVKRFDRFIFIMMLSSLSYSCSSPSKNVYSAAVSKTSAASAVPIEPQSEKSALSDSASKRPSQCISKLDIRIGGEISLLEKSNESGLPLRSGIFDVLLPGNASDLKRMNGMAIFALQVFVREKEGGDLDLPIMAIVHSPSDKKGKVRPGSSVSQLPQIFPVSRIKIVQPDGTADIQRLLGTHTQIIYGFIPLKLLFDEGVVAVRFQGGDQHLEVFRTGSRVQKSRDTPVWLRTIPLSGARLRYSSDRLPDAQLTLRQLADAYCVGRGR
jgi:hypothetical protein